MAVQTFSTGIFPPCGRKRFHSSCLYLWHSFVLAGTRITDKALVDLSKSCPRLSDLNLADCKGVTGTGILAFVKKQPALRALTLSRLAGRFVNDAMIKVRFSVSFLPLCSGGILRFVLCRSP